jgi:hypothetical protein
MGSTIGLHRNGQQRETARLQAAILGSCVIALMGAFAASPPPAVAEDSTNEWIVLSKDLKAFQEPIGDWFTAKEVVVDPGNPRRLKGEPGDGILVNGKEGRTENLLTKEKWGDVELMLEFLIPLRSNSGVKLQGLYEIQIIDSWDAVELTGADCGGVYPRAEQKPSYHHTDKGVPPLVNAAKKPGEWQTLHIVFHAPRFDDQGKKVANARFEKVELNGKLVQDNVEVAHPTGHYYPEPEHAVGPLYLQADHGPVAYRNIRLRPIEPR